MCLGLALGIRQSWREDPHKLRDRRHPDPQPGVRLRKSGATTRSSRGCPRDARGIAPSVGIRLDFVRRRRHRSRGLASLLIRELGLVNEAAVVDRCRYDLILGTASRPAAVADDFEFHPVPPACPISFGRRVSSVSNRFYLTAPLHVLGPAGLIGEADLHGPQGRLVLAMLALEHRRPVGRDELADELWPDELPGSWEVSVKVLISKLRGALRRAAPEVHLEGAVGFYQLQVPRDTWIDVEVASARIHSAEAAFRRVDTAAAAADGLVASMIASRPFLPGFDGPWASSARANLLDVRLRALGLLSEIWLAKGEPDQAGRDAETILRVDPYREEAHRTLIRAHLARGDRASAALAYARCAERLSIDLGVEPAPETRALLDRIVVPTSEPERRDPSS